MGLGNSKTITMSKCSNYYFDNDDCILFEFNNLTYKTKFPIGQIKPVRPIEPINPNLNPDETNVHVGPIMKIQFDILHEQIKFNNYIWFNKSDVDNVFLIIGYDKIPCDKISSNVQIV